MSGFGVPPITATTGQPPPFATPFLDRNGLVSHVWVRYFNSLTVAATGQTNVETLAISVDDNVAIGQIDSSSQDAMLGSLAVADNSALIAAALGDCADLEAALSGEGYLTSPSFAQPASLVGTRANRQTNIPATGLPEGSKYFETDTLLTYTVVAGAWAYSSGVYQLVAGTVPAMPAAGTPLAEDVGYVVFCHASGHSWRLTAATPTWDWADSTGSGWTTIAPVPPVLSGWFAVVPTAGGTFNCYQASGATAAVVVAAYTAPIAGETRYIRL